LEESYEVYDDAICGTRRIWIWYPLLSLDGHIMWRFSQVRPADAHSDKETKLFIGMLPRTADEELVQSIFVKYGQVKEVHIMRTAEVR